MQYPNLKYGVRSPEFIWVPCAQLYSLAETPHPPPPHLRALLLSQHRRHLFVTPSQQLSASFFIIENGRQRARSKLVQYFAHRRITHQKNVAALLSTYSNSKLAYCLCNQSPVSLKSLLNQLALYVNRWFTATCLHIKQPISVLTHPYPFLATCLFLTVHIPVLEF